MSSIMRRRRGPISAIEGSRLEGWASRPQSSQTGRPPSNPSPQSRGSRFVQSPWSPRTLTKTVQLVAYCSAPGCPNDQIQKALCWQPAPPKARPGTRNRLPPTHPTIAPTPYGSSPTDTNCRKYRPSAEKIPRCARDDNTLGFHSTKFVIPSAARDLCDDLRITTFGGWYDFDRPVSRMRLAIIDTAQIRSSTRCCAQGVTYNVLS